MHFLSIENGTTVVTCMSVVHLSYISSSIHVFRNKLCTKVGDCLYKFVCEDLHVRGSFLLSIASHCVP